MRVQDLRDSDHARKWYLFNKRGWVGYPTWFRWEAVIRRGVQGDWCHATIELGGHEERQVQFILGLFGTSLYLTFPLLLPRKWAVGWYKRGEVKNPHWDEDGQNGWRFGFYVHERSLVIQFRRATKFIHLDELLFGPCSAEYLNPKDYPNVPIYMPERTYYANIRLSDDTWTYKRWQRWPLKKVIRRCHCEMVDNVGIPFPGKGENSWDCGEDGLYGMCCPANTVDDAVAKITQSVKETRTKRGSGLDMYVGTEKDTFRGPVA